MPVRSRIPEETRLAMVAEYRRGDTADMIAARHRVSPAMVYHFSHKAGFYRWKRDPAEPARPELPWYQPPSFDHPLKSVQVVVGAPCWRCKGLGSIEKRQTCPLCWGTGKQA